MVEEKILTLNLRKKLIEKPRWKRSNSVVKILKDVLKERTKAEKIKIDEKLNKKIWVRSIKKPLTKLRVKVTKLDDGSVKVESIG
jgi:large subunit ribosomal protein L31e